MPILSSVMERENPSRKGGKAGGVAFPNGRYYFDAARGNGLGDRERFIGVAMAELALARVDDANYDGHFLRRWGEEK